MPVTIDPELKKIIDDIDLIRGGGGGNADRFCVMEAAAYIAGEEPDDEPACVSETIAEFMIGINDSREAYRARQAGTWSGSGYHLTYTQEANAERNKLKPVMEHIIGTRPTKTEPTEIYSSQLDEYIIAKVLQPNPTKGYYAAEKRRQRRITLELKKLGLLADHVNTVTEYWRWEEVDLSHVSTEDAVRIALRLAEFKNKV